MHSLQQVKRLHECYEVFMGVTELLTDVGYIGSQEATFSQ